MNPGIYTQRSKLRTVAPLTTSLRPAALTFNRSIEHSGHKERCMTHAMKMCDALTLLMKTHFVTLNTNCSFLREFFFQLSVTFAAMDQSAQTKVLLIKTFSVTFNANCSFLRDVFFQRLSVTFAAICKHSAWTKNYTLDENDVI